jgi:GntR family transcriptional regulator
MSRPARYLQVRDSIERRIEDTGLKAGDRLPTERELAGELGVARPTLRRSMQLLESAGVIERRQGSGTYVAQPQVSMDMRVLMSFSRGMLSAGLRPGARILVSEHVPADRDLARLFELRTGESVYHLERLRTANGMPVALERSWFPDIVAPALDRKDLETRSIYAIMAEDYGIRLRRAEQELEPVRAEADAVRLLGCHIGEPLMLVRRRAFDETGKPVEYAEDRFLAGRSRFHSEAFVP